MTQEQFLTLIASGDPDQIRQELDREATLSLARNEKGVSAPLLALYHRKNDAADLLARRKEALEPLDVFEAAALGRTELLESLLSRDPGLVNAFSADGFFPLGLAAFFGHDQAVALLLARGADPNLAARNAMKVTAIHAAAAAHSVTITRRLLEAGCDVDARQEQGFTALMEAVHSGQHELARLLLDHGADPEAVEASGRSALSMARAAADQQMGALLTGRGAVA